jgi:hypothetical protein
MGSVVQARLDDETEAALKRIARANRWTASQAVRECIRMVDGQRISTPHPRMVGIGILDEGPGDLATNKQYLEDLGRKSMGKGWRPHEEQGQ